MLIIGNFWATIFGDYATVRDEILFKIVNESQQNESKWSISENFITPP